jgi:hypothetical protein
MRPNTDVSAKRPNLDRKGELDAALQMRAQM